MGRRNAGDPLSGAKADVELNSEAIQETGSRRISASPALYAAACQNAGSSMATELPGYETGLHSAGQRRRPADFCRLDLRCTLSARPNGLAGFRVGRVYRNHN